VLTFSNSLNGPFIYDDFGAFRDNTTIRQLWPLTGPLSPPPAGNPMSGRPVVNLSAAVNYAFSGDDVRGYHIWNVATDLALAGQRAASRR
jgi:protein O-mannosyl-transferase